VIDSEVALSYPLLRRQSAQEIGPGHTE